MAFTSPQYSMHSSAIDGRTDVHVKRLADEADNDGAEVVNIVVDTVEGNHYSTAQAAFPQPVAERKPRLNLAVVTNSSAPRSQASHSAESAAVAIGNRAVMPGVHTHLHAARSLVEENSAARPVIAMSSYSAHGQATTYFNGTAARNESDMDDIDVCGPPAKRMSYPLRSSTYSRPTAISSAALNSSTASRESLSPSTQASSPSRRNAHTTAAASLAYHLAEGAVNHNSSLVGGEYRGGLQEAPGMDYTAKTLTGPISMQPPVSSSADGSAQESFMTLKVPVVMGRNGEVACVFCSKSEATTICLGLACTSFLNGKLPLLCAACAQMLHVHHPDHRLFQCEGTSPVSVTSASGNQSNDDIITSADECQNYQASATSPRMSSKQSKAAASRTKGKSCKMELLETTHTRYMTMLSYYQENPTTSMTDAYRATGISRTTLQDNRWITELKLVDPSRYEEVMDELMKEDTLPRLTLISLSCQEALAEEPLCSVVANMRVSKQLLPFMRETMPKMPSPPDGMKSTK